MKEFLVVKNDTYGVKTGGGDVEYSTIDELAEGAIGIFDESGTLIDPLNPSNALLGDRVYMAVGLSEGSPYLTSLINRATFEYNTMLYEAPAARIMWVGEDSNADGDLNLPTLEKDQIATIVVWDKSKRREEVNKTSRIYNYIVKTGDNAAAVVAGLVAAITADDKAIVDAEDQSNAGVKLTSKVAGIDFAVTMGGILEDATKTYDGNNKHVFGHGTYAQLKEVEMQALVRRGNVNSFLYTNELWKLPSNLVSTTNYNIISCNWRNATEDGLQTLQPTYKKELLIAVDNSNTAVWAAIGSILNAI